MFSTRGRYFKYLGWLLMVLTHGTFDAFCDFEEADVLGKCSFRASCQLVPPNPLDSEMSGVAKQICNMNRTGSHLQLVNGIGNSFFHCVGDAEPSRSCVALPATRQP